MQPCGLWFGFTAYIDKSRRGYKLQNDTVLVVPTLPSVPPKLAAAPDELELFEHRTHSLMSIATMSGCCQVR